MRSPILRRALTISCTALLVVAGALASARADRVVMDDGRTMQCRIVAQDDRTITIEVDAAGSTISRRLDRSKVHSMQADPRDAAAADYVTVPVIGRIGRDVTAAAFRRGLEVACRSRPRYIVLAIDSPGGSSQEMKLMAEALIKLSDQLPTVAFVKNAESTAAVLAMCCKQIYLVPGASIGAVVEEMGIRYEPKTDPQAVAAYAQFARDAAARGGHDPLFIRGMTEFNLNLVLVTEGGKPVLRESGLGKFVKLPGTILRMSDAEAKEYGLSGVAKDMADLGTQVTAAGGGSWREGPRRAWEAVMSTVAWEQAARKREPEQQPQAQPQPAGRSAPAAGATAGTSAAASGASDESRKAALRSDIDTKQKEIAGINSDLADQINEIDARYRSHAIAASTDEAEQRRRTAAAHEREIVAARRAAQAKIDRLQSAIDADHQELKRMRGQ
jgi:hypothetical protein